ncbi:tetratricopeptide repeat protein [Singulisphaera rosea]
MRLVLRKAPTVSARVLKHDQTPASGVRLQVGILKPVLVLPDDLSEQLGGKTDEQGRVRVQTFTPDDIISLKVTSPDLGDQTVFTPKLDDGELAMVLRPTGRLRGHVRTDSGQDVAGLVIQGDTLPTNPDLPNKIHGHFEATTDHDGRFEVSALAEGELRIGVIRSQTSSPLICRLRTYPLIEAGKVTDIEIDMTKGIRARGLVHERGTGLPIVGALVQLDSRPNVGFTITRTDAEGRYEVVLVPGRIRFRCIDAGPYLPSHRFGNLLAMAEEGVEKLDLPPVEVIRSIDARGFVLDQEKKPVVGARVEVIGIDGSQVRGKSNLRPGFETNERGEFILKGIAPDVPLELTAPFGETGTGAPARWLPSATRPITLVVSQENTMSLGGRVVDELGKPIPDADISVYTRYRTSANVDVRRTPSESGMWHLRTDADGRFQTPHRLLRHEDLSFSAQATGKQRGDADWFAPTTPSLFDLTLSPTRPPEQSHAQSRFVAAQQHFLQGDYSRAESEYAEAITEGIKRKVDDITLATWYLGLAGLRFSQGRYFSSGSLADEAVRIRKGLLGEGHPATAEARIALADVFGRDDRADQAEELYHKALASLEQAQGTEHPDYGRALASYGTFLEIQGRAAEAEPNLARGIAIVEKIRGKNSTHLITPLAYRALALKKLGRLNEAETSYRSSVALASKTIGLAHPTATAIIKQYAQFLRDTHREEAARALEEASRRPVR